MDEVLDKIKEQAIKVKDGAIKLTRKMVSKTNNVVDQTKLKFAINETENKIKEEYTEIGKSVYESFEDETEAGDIREKCEKIQQLKADAEELRNQLYQLKETKKCSSCGSYNHKDDVYCSKCGEKLYTEADAEEVDEDEVITVEADSAPEAEAEE